MNTRRWLPRLFLIGAVVGIAIAAWVVKPWDRSSNGITYQTVAVSRGSIAAQVTANGTLSARKTVTVGAQVSGKIVELDVDFNDHVKLNQVIAKLDPTLAQQQVDQMQAAYDLALANQKKAEVALFDSGRQRVRNTDMYNQQLIAKGTLETFEITDDTNKALLKAAIASVLQAKANLDQAKTQLEYCTIYSPVNGTVLSRAVDVGQTVASSLSAPTLFTIAEDLSRMQIDTSVAESDVGRLKDGMAAQFTVDAFPGRTFPGVVRQVRNAATTTQGVVTYDAVIDVDNTDGSLRPGMTANVAFVLDQVADAIKIPNSALRFKPTREQMQVMFAEAGMGSGMGSGGGHHWGSGGGSGGHHHGGGAGGSADGSAAGSAGSASGSGSTGSGSAGSASGGDDDINVNQMTMGAPPGGGGFGPPPGMGGPGGGGNGQKQSPDRKMLWKLDPATNKPVPVRVKIGLTDGSATQLVEGKLEPGDLLITSVEGIAAGASRKMGGF